MTKLAGLLTLAILLASVASHAQNNCPDGFRYTGTLHGVGGFGNDFNARRELLLPENAQIDMSYQQRQVRAAQGNSLAHSNMTAADIPKGIVIIPSGSTDLEKGWAVSDPVLSLVSDSGGAKRYQFGMKLYCTVGHSEASRNFGGCNVDVDVCYKYKD
jgi:hypothetical protein